MRLLEGFADDTRKGVSGTHLLATEGTGLGRGAVVARGRCHLTWQAKVFDEAKAGLFEAGVLLKPGRDIRSGPTPGGGGRTPPPWWGGGLGGPVGGFPGDSKNRS